LQSVSHPNIFAAGDCASMERQALPKSGVYAVRQGPVLADNLRRSALGKALRRYRPQRRFLSLLATGDKQAVASRGCWFAAGAWIWQWKSRIDTRFVRRFSPAPQAEADSGSGLPAAMRCGGCGAKVGSDALQDVLRRLDGNAAVDAGTTLDDAAIFTPPSGQQMVQTIDHFRAFIDDPYMIGRIGANHCLGDIYAMGATPDSALALANIPFSQGRIMADTLYQLMRGAADTLTEADTRLIGGHSSEAAELAFGLAVNGYIAPGQALLKSGLQVGQALVLSKPLGTGTLLAANMRHGARGRWIDDALASMQQSNGSAAAIIRQHRATACTDITGFGLLGHLLEMLHASGVAASLSIDSIPLLDGAMECLQQGYFSSLHADNSQQQRAIARVAKGAHGTRMEILYDPQTAGGLLAGIPPGQESLCVQALCAAGYHAAIIGQVQPLEHEPRIQCQ
jgi:selenide,water dikinase